MEFDCTEELYFLPIKLLLINSNAFEFFHNYTKVAVFARKAYIGDSNNSLAKKMTSIGDGTRVLLCSTLMPSKLS